ncbi:MAG: zinc finger domain protein [Sphingobacteriaceae bacterium]|jgi:uncharacterized Zn finger protein|nr:zinc finger domain protein [Sphingobacteriaceae bacterium]
MISFSRFEQQLPTKQLQKGRFYFEEELVCNLNESAPGIWSADVSGKEDYRVQLTITNDEVAQIHCDCPHEVEFCKHVVAVLYGIAEKTGTQEEKDFVRLVNEMPVERLREVVIRVGEGNGEFREVVRTQQYLLSL